MVSPWQLKAVPWYVYSEAFTRTAAEVKVAWHS